ncbi:MAG: hypothetical protein ACT4TC_25620 [Myxococcaceae bacterium]
MTDMDLGPTRLKRGPASSTPDFQERVALFTVVMAKSEAISLLDGLVDARGKAEARRLARLDSASRQARVAATFGPRADAPDRLRVLFEDAGRPLQRQMHDQLPVYLKRAVELKEERNLAPNGACRAREALARRMVWEAIR